jgi:hypothetical protein
MGDKPEQENLNDKLDLSEADSNEAADKLALDAENRQDDNLTDKTSPSMPASFDQNNPFQLVDSDQTQQSFTPSIPDDVKKIAIIAGLAGAGVLAYEGLRRLHNHLEESNLEARSLKSTEPRLITVIGDKVVNPGVSVVYGDVNHPYTEGSLAGQKWDLASASVDESGKVFLRALSDQANVYIKDKEGNMRHVKVADGEVVIKPGESFSINSNPFIEVGKQYVSNFDVSVLPGDKERFGPHDDIRHSDTPVSDKERALLRARTPSLDMKIGDAYELAWRDGYGPVLINSNSPDADFIKGSALPRNVQIGFDDKGLYVLEKQNPEAVDPFGPSRYSVHVQNNGKGQFEQLAAGVKHYVKPTDNIWFGEPNQGDSTELKLYQRSDRQLADLVNKKPENVPEPVAVRSLQLSDNNKTIKDIPPGSTLGIAVNENKEAIIITNNGNQYIEADARMFTDKNGDAFIKVSGEPLANGKERKIMLENANGSTTIITARDGYVPIGANDKFYLLGKVDSSKSLSLNLDYLQTHAATIDGKQININGAVELGASGSFDPLLTSAERVEFDRFSYGQVSDKHARLGYDDKGRLFVRDIGISEIEGEGHAGTWIQDEQGKTRCLRQDEIYYPKFGEKIWLGMPNSDDAIRLDINVNQAVLTRFRPPDAPGEGVLLSPPKPKQSPSTSRNETPEQNAGEIVDGSNNTETEKTRSNRGTNTPPNNRVKIGEIGEGITRFPDSFDSNLLGIETALPDNLLPNPTGELSEAEIERVALSLKESAQENLRANEEALRRKDLPESKRRAIEASQVIHEAFADPKVSETVAREAAKAGRFREFFGKGGGRFVPAIILAGMLAQFSKELKAQEIDVSLPDNVIPYSDKD